MRDVLRVLEDGYRIARRRILGICAIAGSRPRTAQRGPNSGTFSRRVPISMAMNGPAPAPDYAPVADFASRQAPIAVAPHEGRVEVLRDPRSGVAIETSASESLTYAVQHSPRPHSLIVARARASGSRGASCGREWRRRGVQPRRKPRTADRDGGIRVGFRRKKAVFDLRVDDVHLVESDALGRSAAK